MPLTAFIANLIDNLDRAVYRRFVYLRKLAEMSQATQAFMIDLMVQLSHTLIVQSADGL
jgi:hypothetical protein